MKQFFDEIHKNLLKVIFPEFCCICEQGLLNNEKIICTTCQQNLNKTNIIDFENNEIKQKFEEFFKIVKSYSFLFYQDHNNTQKLIHQLKYFKQEALGQKIAELLWNEIKHKNFFDDIDYIVPVPVHQKRFYERGYNQLFTFCDTLGNQNNITVEKSLLKRTKYNDSLSKKNRNERKIILESFEIQDINKFEGKHFLIVDDVITTGSTIRACAEELLKIKNSKISILSMSYTKN